ncbi:metallophosphoesterase [Ignicoccus pacificus DSM 13166]|uniref:Metallophosphoesterase n=1 Tax=Ignicoccus pacificus DSM 13166 TaxID=940294 RepID=A0A977K9I2_9CREN|nr:metallophosphoesterase [Ignicoccus pacificus DSM 13166]
MLSESIEGVEVEILAFSDVHTPRYLPLLIKSIQDLKEKNFDVVMMAGDLVDRSNVEEFSKLLEVLKSNIKYKYIVAVFGNEEYREKEEEFKESYPEVRWLNDEYLVLKLNKGCLGVVGSRGSLLRPTSWQRKNLPGIAEEYKRKPEVIRQLIKEVKKECPNVVYLSHYAPTWKTLVGESRHIWPYLGDPRIEKVLKEEGVHVAIHGHVHRGRVSYVHTSTLTIYNVALPARGNVTIVKMALQLTI